MKNYFIINLLKNNFENIFISHYSDYSTNNQMEFLQNNKKSVIIKQSKLKVCVIIIIM